MKIKLHESLKAKEKQLSNPIEVFLEKAYDQLNQDSQNKRFPLAFNWRKQYQLNTNMSTSGYYELFITNYRGDLICPIKIISDNNDDNFPISIKLIINDDTLFFEKNIETALFLESKFKVILSNKKFNEYITEFIN